MKKPTQWSRCTDHPCKQPACDAPPHAIRPSRCATRFHRTAHPFSGPRHQHHKALDVGMRTLFQSRNASHLNGKTIQTHTRQCVVKFAPAFANVESKQSSKSRKRARLISLIQKLHRCFNNRLEIVSRTCTQYWVRGSAFWNVS